MTTRIDETPHHQQDRVRLAARRLNDEPRNIGAVPHETPTRFDSAHAGFDADLNPVDDEDINTHGSER